MKRDKPREPRAETSMEVAEVRAVRGDRQELSRYWNGRFEETYEEILEGLAEFGRHGVIAEHLQRRAGGGSVLDAGCGTGILAELIHPERFRYYGVDISDRALGFARSRRARRNAKFIHSAIEEYTPEEPLNAVVLNEVLYYLDPEQVLGKLRGWLVEPRLLVSSTFDFPEGDAVLSLLERLLEDRNTVIVSNPGHDLKWTVVSGFLR